MSSQNTTFTNDGEEPNRSFSLFTNYVYEKVGDVTAGIGRICWPTACLSCFSPHSSYVCSPCLESLERGNPSYAMAHIQRLPADFIPLNSVNPIWMFDKSGALQTLHRRLKYGNLPALGTFLGRRIGHKILTEQSSLPDGIVPIPLHAKRYLERGYNQSALLAKGIARTINRPILTECLVRSRFAQTQTGLSRADRWQNQVDSFDVKHEERIAGMTVMLIDDVLTTGATATAAGLALHQAGAASIHLVTLAMAR